MGKGLQQSVATDYELRLRVDFQSPAAHDFTYSLNDRVQDKSLITLRPDLAEVRTRHLPSCSTNIFHSA